MPSLGLLPPLVYPTGTPIPSRPNSPPHFYPSWEAPTTLSPTMLGALAGAAHVIPPSAPMAPRPCLARLPCGEQTAFPPRPPAEAPTARFEINTRLVAAALAIGGGTAAPTRTLPGSSLRASAPQTWRPRRANGGSWRHTPALRLGPKAAPPPRPCAGGVQPKTRYRPPTSPPVSFGRAAPGRPWRFNQNA